MFIFYDSFVAVLFLTTIQIIFLKVLEKGNLLFMEVMNSLQNMVSSFSHSKQTANLMGSTKDLSDVEEMLKQEKSDFEVSAIVI